MGAARLTTSRSADLDRIIEDFESACAGSVAISLADYLPPAGHASYLEVLTELIRVDLEYRCRQGEDRRVEDYLREFPELAQHPEQLKQIAFEEYRQRRDAGQEVSAQEYRQRLGISLPWQSETGAIPAAGFADGAASAGRVRPGSGEVRSVEVFDQLFDESIDSSAQPSGDRPVEYVPAPAQRPASIRGLKLPEVGSEFLGFHLVAELGQGAFGKVYLARQGELADRHVALKVSRDLSGESRSLAQMQHTNIVPIYSIHRANPLQAVCMPYFGHITLADVMKDLRGRHSLPESGRGLITTLGASKSVTQLLSSTGSHLSDVHHPSSVPGMTTALPAGGGANAPAETPVTLKLLEKMTYVQAIVWIGARLADGLAHAHERGILHRDLKPANVLLTTEGQPMLLDFNLAQDVKQNDATSAYIGGTLQYMAPEHLEAFKGVKCAVDERSDIYSLGAILYELLTGQPFTSEKRGPLDRLLDQLVKARRGPLPSLRGANPAIPADVEAIIHHCLEPDPQNRYRSARALFEDLEQHLLNRPLRHAPETMRVRLTKWAKRNRWIGSPGAIAAMSAAVVLLAAAAWVSVDRWRTRVRDLELRAEAESTFEAFQRQRKQALTPLVNIADQDYLRRGLETGYAVLEPYQVLENKHWRDRPAVQYLPEKDRERLESDVGELLRLLAQTEPLVGGDPRAKRLLDHDGEGKIAPLQEQCVAARAEMLDGQYAQALARLQKVTVADPSQAFAWYMEGYCQHILQHHADAMNSYTAGIALDPDVYLPYLARGHVHADQRNYDKAIEDFTRGIELREKLRNSDFRVPLRDAYIDRALVHQYRGDFESALADLDRAEKTGPETTSLHFRRASLLEASGESAQARKELDLGMQKTPTDELSFVVRAYTKFMQPGASLAELAGALDDLDKALELNRRSRDAMTNKAYLLAEQLGPREEHMGLLGAIAAAPGSPLAASALLLAGSASKAQRQQQALQTLDAEVSLYPDLVTARSGRGVLLARMGNREAALQDAQECLKRNPPPMVLFQVGGIYALTSGSDLKDRGEACRWLAGALLQGFGYDWIDRDPDLDLLRGDPKFQELRRAARNLQFAAGPARGANKNAP
jgi:serine/threonine protein kinase